MTRGHGGARGAGADRRAARSALAMKGERPAEIVGLARTMRAHAVQLSTPVRRRVRHLRHRRRPLRHVQHLVVRGARGGRVRRARSPSTATARCRAAAAAPTCSRRSASTSRRRRRSSSAASREAGIAFFFAPTFHPSMQHAGADAPRARRADGVQPARPADESGRRDAAAGRRAAARADRAAGALAAAARLRARLGRARRRRHRRDLDDRLHEGVRVPRRRGATRSTCIPADVGLPKAAPGALKGGDAQRQRRDHRARCWTAAPVPRARRRAAERRRGAVRRRHARRRSRTASRMAAAAIDRGGRDRRSTRWSRRLAGGGPGRSDDQSDSPICSRTIVAATRRIVDVRRDARAARRARAARGGGDARAAAVSRRRLGAADRVNVIAECKRRSPSHGVLAAAYDPVAIARQYAARRRGRDLGADRADVLRRRARAPAGGARGGRRCRCCARTSSSTSTSCSRRGPRGADAVLLIVAALGQARAAAAAAARARARAWRRSSKCTTTTS